MRVFMRMAIVCVVVASCGCAHARRGELALIDQGEVVAVLEDGRVTIAKTDGKLLPGTYLVVVDEYQRTKAVLEVTMRKDSAAVCRVVWSPSSVLAGDRVYETPATANAPVHIAPAQTGGLGTYSR